MKMTGLTDQKRAQILNLIQRKANHNNKNDEKDHKGLFDLINADDATKAHIMDVEEAKFTELVNTELTRLFKVQN